MTTCTLHTTWSHNILQYSSSAVHCVSILPSIKFEPLCCVPASMVQKFTMQCRIELAGVDRASEQEQTAHVPQKSWILNSIASVVVIVMHWWILLHWQCDDMHTMRNRRMCRKSLAVFLLSIHQQRRPVWCPVCNTKCCMLYKHFKRRSQGIYIITRL